MELPNANRGIYKAIYAPILLDILPADATGGNTKANVVLSFAPQLAEVKQLRTLGAEVPKSGKKQPVNSAPSNKVLDAVHRYLSHAASTPVAVLSPFNDLANDLANVPSADIIAFGSSLAQIAIAASGKRGQANTETGRRGVTGQGCAARRRNDITLSCGCPAIICHEPTNCDQPRRTPTS